MPRGARYISALHFDWLTPLYDPLVRLVMQERKFKAHLIRQAVLRPGDEVLDLGCGTATLTILIKQTEPRTRVVGIDGDSRVLAIARRKAARAKASIELEVGMADQLPHPDGSFDRVLSSLLFHHLTTANKEQAFAEAYRVLRPGGALHLVDFGPPGGAMARAAILLLARIEEAGDNIHGLLPAMARQAGFAAVHETGRFSTLFGTLTALRCPKPG